MRWWKHVVGAAAIVLLIVAAVALVARADRGSSGPAPPGAVEIVGFAYEPDAIEIVAGTTITWTNRDPAAHTVDSEVGELSSDSIRQGATFELRFDTPGTYAYFCAFHPFMKGTVEVTGK